MDLHRETDNLRRRLAGNYRNPGPRQHTSLRAGRHRVAGTHRPRRRTPRRVTTEPGPPGGPVTRPRAPSGAATPPASDRPAAAPRETARNAVTPGRSEEHTSELQSRRD